MNIQEFALNASLTVCPSHIVEPLHLKRWWRQRGVGELEKYFCTGKKIKLIKKHPGKPSGVEYRVGDPTKMLQIYEPKISLEEGIARALKA